MLHSGRLGNLPHDLRHLPPETRPDILDGLRNHSAGMASEMIEIRWHGRGGQGAKTAAEMVARVALREGRHSQGFPEYGPERAGAPIRGFTRVSDAEIRLHCAIEQPDVSSCSTTP